MAPKISVKACKAGISLLKCCPHSFLTFPLPIIRPSIHRPAVVATDALQHRNHPIQRFAKARASIHEFVRPSRNPVQLAILRLQELKEIRNGPSWSILSPLKLVLPSVLLHIIRDKMDEGWICFEVCAVVTAAVFCRPVDDAQLRVEIEVFVLSIAICQTNDMAIAILVSVSMLN